MRHQVQLSVRAGTTRADKEERMERGGEGRNGGMAGVDRREGDREEGKKEAADEEAKAEVVGRGREMSRSRRGARGDEVRRRKRGEEAEEQQRGEERNEGGDDEEGRPCQGENCSLGSKVLLLLQDEKRGDAEVLPAEQVDAALRSRGGSDNNVVQGPAGGRHRYVILSRNGTEVSETPIDAVNGALGLGSEQRFDHGAPGCLGAHGRTPLLHAAPHLKHA